MTFFRALTASLSSSFCHWGITAVASACETGDATCRKVPVTRQERLHRSHEPQVPGLAEPSRLPSSPGARQPQARGAGCGTHRTLGTGTGCGTGASFTAPSAGHPGPVRFGKAEHWNRPHLAEVRDLLLHILVGSCLDLHLGLQGCQQFPEAVDFPEGLVEQNLVKIRRAGLGATTPRRGEECCSPRTGFGNPSGSSRAKAESTRAEPGRDAGRQAPGLFFARRNAKTLQKGKTSRHEPPCLLLRTQASSLTFRASAPVTATILRMPLAIASSETITKGPAWPEFCRCLWEEPRKSRKKRE